MKRGESFLTIIGKLESAKVAGDTNYIVTCTLILLTVYMRHSLLIYPTKYIQAWMI